MLIAHLSDLHLRDTGDVAWLDRQLSRIAGCNPTHLAVTGDLLDRWDPSLLARALDAFHARGFLAPERLTLLHGNHDLASSGGHPRRNTDLYRLALRFWDPPPLLKRRRRAFHAAVAARAVDIARPAPWTKSLSAGLRVAVIDSVPLPWRPFAIHGRSVVVQHAIGGISENDAEWLGTQRGATPLIVVMHHYPLPTLPFAWTPERHGRRIAALARVVREVRVPMAIPEPDRERFWHAAHSAGTRLVLCGHVHRARLDWHDGIAVGLNGQSGAEWAGRTIAFYEIGARSVEMRSEQVR